MGAGGVGLPPLPRSSWVKTRFYHWAHIRFDHEDNLNPRFCADTLFRADAAFVIKLSSSLVVDGSHGDGRDITALVSGHRVRVGFGSDWPPPAGMRPVARGGSSVPYYHNVWSIFVRLFRYILPLSLPLPLMKGCLATIST